MDPLTIGLGIAGLGMQLFGGLSGASVSKQQAKVSMDEATNEQSINEQKQQQMYLQSQRNQLEVFRNIQRARSAGLQAATTQGAQFGSGLAGGQAQAVDQGLTNSRSISQNLEIGENIAGFNNNISADKIQMAQLGGEAATDAGIASLGGALIKSGPIIGQLGKGVGFGNIGNNFFGGGSPSGY